MLDQAKRVKIRQQKAIAIVEKKKQSAKDQILAITDGTVVGEHPRGSLDSRRKRIIEIREKNVTNASSQSNGS
jgi:hypothetical protein